MSDPKIDSLDIVGLKYLALVYKYCQGNKKETASRLGITEKTVYNMLVRCWDNDIDAAIAKPKVSLAKKQVLKQEMAKLFYPLPTNAERLEYLNSMLNKKDVFTTRIDFL